MPPANTTDKGIEIVGWVSTPNNRGTIDIIWSCLVTISLTSWSQLCLNVSSPKDSYWFKVFRRLWLTLLGVLGPEFILMLAMGQYAAAERSLARFNDSGHDKWTLKHSYFANMGGFVLHSEGFPPFPINASQLHYLVSHGYVDMPTTTVEEIDDKNKKDTTVRVLTIIQISWFTASVLARAGQGLSITTLELTALAFIAISFATTYYWFGKPTNVETAIPLISKVPIHEIVRNAGPSVSAEMYRNTPLDFVDPELWSWKLYWEYGISILHILQIHFDDGSRPIDRLGNVDFPPLHQRDQFVGYLFQLVYAAIYMAAWNFHFPTRTESTLWRISAIGTMVIIVFYNTYDQLTYTTIERLQTCTALQKFWPYKIGEKIPCEREVLASTSPWLRALKKPFLQIRILDSRKDHRWGVPVRSAVMFVSLFFIYSTFRGYILLEDVLSLRSLPADAYQTVNWSTFLPHIT